MCLIRGGLLPLVLGGILVLLSLFTVEASLMGKGLGELLQEFRSEFQSEIRILNKYAVICFLSIQKVHRLVLKMLSEFFKNFYLKIR
jgi:H+/Cl- antiporter ClcA